MLTADLAFCSSSGAAKTNDSCNDLTPHYPPVSAKWEAIRCRNDMDSVIPKGPKGGMIGLDDEGGVSR